MKPKKKQLRPNVLPHLYLNPASSARQARTKQAIQQSLWHNLRLGQLTTPHGNAVLFDDQVAAEENLNGKEIVLTSESNEITSEINSFVTTAVAFTETRTDKLGKQLFSACTMRNEHLHYYAGLESYDKFKLSVVQHKLKYYNSSLPTVSILDQFFL